MIARLARALSRRSVALVVVLVVLAIGSLAALQATKLEQEDDLLAFLPKNDPDVVHFRRLARRFGGLDVALVGLAADNVFAAPFVKRLQKLTRELEDVRGLDQVLSLTNLVDFVPDPVKGGIVTGPLVRTAPTNAKEQRALRRKVLSRDHAVGNLVARDGKAVLIYCFLAHGSDPRAVGQHIREVVGRYHPKDKTYWGGGPFIAAHIYDSTRADMRRLTPWAVLAMVIVMMIAFRDIRGTCLALLSTGFGIVISLGLMATFGVRINLALGSMPIILFAVGSAYGIHVLARYYKLAQTRAVEEAVVTSIETVGPTVLAAGLTTVVSLLSFVTMDLAPMRSFGLFTAIGVLSTLILSLTFVPAVITLLRFRGRKVPGEEAGLRVLELIVRVARRRRVAVSATLGALCAVGLALAFNVDSRIELSNLFAHDSEPARAERFMRARFGGSTFLQVHVVGDLERPEVLRELRLLGDRIRLLPGVASVTHIAGALAIANEAMEGLRRVPDSPAKVKLLMALISGDPSVGQLMSKDRREALMQVKLRESNADAQEALLTRVESLARRASRAVRVVPVTTSRHKARRLRLVALRLAALWAAAGQPLDEKQRNGLFVALAMAPKGSPDKARLVAALARFLRSQENTVAIDDAKKARALAVAIVELGGPAAAEAKLRGAVAGALGKQPASSEVDDLLVGLTTPLDEIYKRERSRARARGLLRRAKLALPAGRRGERLLEQAATALLGLDSPRILLAANEAKGAGVAAGSFAVRAGGMPVLHRALSRSAVRNQLGSLASALLPVLIIMMVLFRSPTAGLLASVPTLVTLVVIYGGMALIGVHLDIGTAMLACIILGAGVDYAVHLVAAWRGSDIDRAAINAVTRTGTAIWTNALAVAIGFGMLTLGEAKPLQNVGGLTAVAMIVAATATFALIPALARRSSYRRGETVSPALRAALVGDDAMNQERPGSVSTPDAATTKD